MLNTRVPEPEIKEIQYQTRSSPFFTLSIPIAQRSSLPLNNESLNPNGLSELKTIYFSARFDSYIQAKLNETFDPYLILPVLPLITYAIFLKFISLG